MIKNRLIAIDIFAGVGGFSLGIKQSGFDVVSSVEVDPINCCYYKFNFPETNIICKDICTITGTEIQDIFINKNVDIDLVFGGSPCQSFSINGQRNSLDTRSNLPFQFVRIVNKLQPKYFIFENVPGLTFSKCKSVLLELITAFKNIGYLVKEDYKILNASNYNTPQLRNILFLLGCRNEGNLPSYPTTITNNRSNKTASNLLICLNTFDAINDLPNIEHNQKLLTCSYSSNVEYGKPSTYAAILRGFVSEEDDYSYKRTWDNRILTCSLKTIHTQECIKRFNKVKSGAKDVVSRCKK